MSTLGALVKRNSKLFFKDKGMFFSALITPLILLILYATFLQNVYESSFRGGMEAFGVTVDESLLGGCVGGQLFSSLLAVCCVTVAFCSNLLMVQDKVTGARRDLTISPVRSGTLALGYYASTLLSTLIICVVAMGASLLYVAQAGWYLTVTDILLMLLDVFLLVMFGTALSSIINHFLSTQGQMSAVGTIISAGYGFLCGAYMPISQFSEGLQKALGFLPGTYGTSLLRNHALRGVFEEMGNQGFPKEVIEGIRDSIDCNLYFFGEKVGTGTMYLILGATVVLLVAVYVLINVISCRKAKK